MKIRALAFTQKMKTCMTAIVIQVLEDYDLGDGSGRRSHIDTSSEIEVKSWLVDVWGF